MKIVVLDGYSLNPGDLSWDALKALGDVTIYERTDKATFHQRAADAEVLLINKMRFRKEDFQALPNLKYIGVLATGYNIIDIEAATEHGVVVTNVPTYGTQAVAQFVFAHLLEICHQIHLHASLVKQGKWHNHPDFCFWERPLIELYGKTMGIVGGGRIGLETAKIAHAFGMKVLVYTRRPKANPQEEWLTYVTFETLLSDSDVVSLHLPLTEETRGMIDDAAIEKMKTGAILINTSRGPVIDEKALLKALKSGKIHAAGLDVLSKEPPEEDNPLFELDNVNITPHIAWAPKETRNRLLGIAVNNLKRFLQGECVNQVNGGDKW